MSVYELNVYLIDQSTMMAKPFKQHPEILESSRGSYKKKRSSRRVTLYN